MSPDKKRFSPDEHHWELLQRQLLWAHESEKEPGTSGYAIRDTPPTGAWLVVSGKCQVVQEEERVRAYAGDWVFPRSGLRDQFFDPGTRILSIGFLARWPHGQDLIVNPVCRILKHPLCDELTEKARHLVSSLKQVVGAPCNWERSRRWRDHLDIEDHFKIDSAFQAWLACFLRVAEDCGATVGRMLTRDLRVSAAIAEMREGPLGSAEALARVQNNVGLSRRRLDELFLKETSMSAAAFHEKLLLQRVSDLLLDLRLQMKEVAHEAGFNHHSSFSRWFRQRTGMTPSEYRSAEVSGKKAQGSLPAAQQSE